MPTLITDFTSYDEIRAVLGVSDEELEDTTLALPIYLRLLQMEFSDIHTDAESKFLSTKALPVLTADEQKFIDLASVFSAYAIAYHLLTSVSLFAPRHITDGRASTDRVNDPFADVREGVISMLSTLRVRLLAILNILGIATNAASLRVYFEATGLAVNPVTSV